MKLLIFGSRGWIGSQFLELLDTQQIYYIEAVSRLDDTISVQNELTHIQPTHVVCVL